MSEKRFECVFIEDEEFGGTFRRLKDNETGIMHMTCDVADLLNFQNTQIKILKEENEQLRKENVFLMKQRNYCKGIGKASVRKHLKTNEATAKKTSENYRSDK